MRLAANEHLARGSEFELHLQCLLDGFAKAITSPSKHISSRTQTRPPSGIHDTGIAKPRAQHADGTPFRAPAAPVDAYDDNGAGTTHGNSTVISRPSYSPTASAMGSGYRAHLHGLLCRLCAHERCVKLWVERSLGHYWSTDLWQGSGRCFLLAGQG